MGTVNEHSLRVHFPPDRMPRLSIVSFSKSFTEARATGAYEPKLIDSAYSFQLELTVLARVVPGRQVSVKRKIGP